MATDDLSPECKQTLRDLDHILASTRVLLIDPDDRTSSVSPPAAASISALSQHLTASFAQLDTLDNPCRRVLRDLDHTSTAVSMLQTRQAHAMSGDLRSTGDLLSQIERAILELRPYLNL